ncbi:hypothetical protein FKP32DRAFT_657539 [Trametes sanguinea]|nr:hypothetical protein FKP32DRAFT_657539 [Trametes sanguinea]
MYRTARAQHAPGALQEAALLPRSCCSCLIAAVLLTRLRALLSPTGQQVWRFNGEGWPVLRPPYYPPYLYPCQHVSGFLRRPSVPIHLDRPRSTDEADLAGWLLISRSAPDSCPAAAIKAQGEPS